MLNVIPEFAENDIWQVGRGAVPSWKRGGITTQRYLLYTVKREGDVITDAFAASRARGSVPLRYWVATPSGVVYSGSRFTT